MNESMTLYHGSSEIVENPTYGKGRKHNDYGLGFYCTEDSEIAKEWACKDAADGYSNKYILDSSNLKILNLNSGDYSILHWMSVLIQNRVFDTRTPIAGRAKKFLAENYSVNINSYDVIIGYRADDAYYNFASMFLNNAITIDQLAGAMKLGKLGEQVVLKSRWAFSNILYIGSEAAECDTYFPLRKERSERADNEFLKLSQEESDGLYLIDIIRKGIRDEDLRIP